MCAIFSEKGQKKGKKGQNIWKFGQKCKKFENILKKSRWFACDYHTHTARKAPDSVNLIWTFFWKHLIVITIMTFLNSQVLLHNK